MKEKSYIPLHLHTSMGSVLDSIVNATLDKSGKNLLAEKATEYNMPAIGISDHGSMAAVLSHYKTCKQYGIKSILGCEFYICDDIKVKDKNSKYNHLVVLAKNNIGYKNLMKLSSIGYLDGFYYKPRIDFETLSKYSEGLIVLSACLGSELDRMITSEDYDDFEAIALINKYKSVFGEDYYLEMQSADSPEQEKVNKEIVNLSKETNTKFVVTTDVHFLNKEDFNAHNIYININQNRDTENYKYCYLQSREEIVNILSKQIGLKNAELALDNTYLVADKCNVELKLHQPKLPKMEAPIDYEDDFDWIKGLTFKGLEERGCLDKPNKQEYIDRVNMELDIIHKKDFDGYFLILMNILQEAKKRGIPIGEGRGSSGGSCVAYALGITNVDSIEYDLDFGRFLTMERTELCDIDTDVATSRRGDLIDLITEMFGYENVAQVATFGTLASKAVIDAVGKIMHIDKEICASLKDNINDNEGVKSLIKTSEYKQYKEFIDTCITLEGCPRSIGVHAGAVCCSGNNKPTTEYAPVMLNKDNRIITQFEMHDVEDADLVKYDMLGLTSLDYIADTLKLIGNDYYSYKFDYNDQDVFNMISNGENSGVFQADSNFAERVLTSIKPKNISELADAISIGRPDTVKFLEPYVNAKFKGIKPKQIHPLFDSILSRTYGCLVYQEQLMKIFKVFAGFSDGEADGVRKCTAKKQVEKLDKYFDMFRVGAKKNGYSDEVIEQIIEFVKDNAQYQFNASHAVAYATTTYKTAYLKYHYPVEYMTALINNQKSDNGSVDFEKVKRYIKSVQNDNIEVTIPDINQSGKMFMPNAKERKIYYGLSLVKGLSQTGIEIVLANRPYSSFKDFLDKVGLELNKSDVISLIKAGAFNNITTADKMKLFKMYYSVRFDNKKEDTKPIAKCNKNHIKFLLDEGMIAPDQQEDKEYCTAVLNKERKVKGWKDFKEQYCEGTDLDFEMEVLSCHLSGNPFDNVVIPDWDKVEYDCNGWLGGVAVTVKETTTKKGEKMCFLNLDVNGEMADIVVFPRSYLEYKGILKAGNCLVCKVTKQGKLKGILQSCEPLKDYLQRTKSMQRSI